MNEGYFRTPTVGGDTVVFVSEDDLWSVPLDGGTARRLTAGLGGVANPRISPDASRVAFSSREEFHLEVWVMPLAGGPATRVTFLGANSTVVGWTPDGRIAFRSHHSRPFLRWYEIFAADPATGIVERLPYGFAHEVTFGPAGGVVVGRNTIDPGRWKRYRGGEAGDLWIDAKGSGSFKRLVRTGGNPAHPMWAAGRIFFVDDYEGIGNIYSCTTTGRGITRHTDHDEFYARFASSDGSTIVYQHAGEVWALDPSAAAPRRVEVVFPSPRTQRNRKFAPADRHLQGVAVHPNGHSIAVEARGRIAAMPFWEGAVRNIGASAGVRYRLGRWLPDGERLVVVSDESGEEALEIHRPDGKRKRFDGIDIGRVHELVVSPRANDVAVANHRLELILADLDAGTSRVLDRSSFERIQTLAWSPDGRWLAYAVSRSMQTTSLALADVTSRTVHTIESEFRDYRPVFDPTGSYLYFISYRQFDPVPDAHFFDLGFPKGALPYVISLRADAPNPLLPPPRNLADDENGEAKDKDARKEKAPPEVTIDLNGVAQRIQAVPVPESRYVDIAAIKDKIVLLSRPVRGALGTGDDGQQTGGALSVYDLKRQKHEHLLDGVDEFAVSDDGTTMVVRVKNRLRALRAGRKPEKGKHSDEPGRATGWLDLSRIRLSVDPAAEWRQMYHEAWRLMRDNFWVEDMSKVDWERVRARYLPLVEKVATRIEFSDLMWEMQGEMGTSHAYEMGGDHRPPPGYRLGLLAADLELDAKGRWKVAHIVRGDPWDRAARSPLTEMGVDVREGDTLLAVNGSSVSRSVPPASLLVHQGGQRVELRIGDAAGRKPRVVVVQTLTDETPARYREWVEGNRASVQRATKGKVGYLHIPNMSGVGFSEFHRAFRHEVEHDGLIVDVRVNGGGNVSQILIEKLARRRLGYDVTRWGVPEPYPSDSMLGPIVCVSDEHAGSDGDIFTHVFKLMKIGPVVGKRTWGGVIGIWPRHELADGGYTTQPEFAFWFHDVGWGVENFGTEPDVEVDIAPHDYAAGRDPQLDKAIELVMAALKRDKPSLPRFSKRPNLRLPTLPPRGSGA